MEQSTPCKISGGENSVMSEMRLIHKMVLALLLMLNACMSTNESHHIKEIPQGKSQQDDLPPALTDQDGHVESVPVTVKKQKILKKN